MAMVRISGEMEGPKKLEFQTDRRLENALLAAQISEGSNVRDDEGHAELIVVAHLPQRDAAVFEGEPAARAVVADLHQLVLPGIVDEVVAQPSGEVEAATRFSAIADEHANLIGEWLEDGVGEDAEMRDGGEEFAVGFDLQESAHGAEFVELRIVLEKLFGIEASRGSYFEVADDRGGVARAQREGKGSYRVQRFQNVALAVDDGTSEGGIEIVFLCNAPGNEFLRLVL